jgi:hypothetical protein
MKPKKPVPEPRKQEWYRHDGPSIKLVSQPLFFFAEITRGIMTTLLKENEMNITERYIFWTGTALAATLWIWNAYTIISAIVK